MWMTECQRVLKPGATFATFTDWRQLPTMTDAVQAGGLIWRAVAVWDKGVGRPMRGRFRNHIEFIIWATNGPHTDPQESYPSAIMRHSSPGGADRLHMTEKPVSLIEELLTLTPPGCLVADPFMGAGTTGVAAAKTGRRFLGVELTAHYAAVAEQRMRLLMTGQPTVDAPQAVIDFGEWSA
jgi:site-specific DNA-methyltransferase (adenine-specific)